jgi:hypothetical protein
MDKRQTQKDNETWKQYEESAEVMEKERQMSALWYEGDSQGCRTRKYRKLNNQPLMYRPEVFV